MLDLAQDTCHVLQQSFWDIVPVTTVRFIVTFVARVVSFLDLGWLTHCFAIFFVLFADFSVQVLKSMKMLSSTARILSHVGSTIILLHRQYITSILSMVMPWTLQWTRERPFSDLTGFTSVQLWMAVLCLGWRNFWSQVASWLDQVGSIYLWTTRRNIWPMSFLSQRTIVLF